MFAFWVRFGVVMFVCCMHFGEGDVCVSCVFKVHVMFVLFVGFGVVCVGVVGGFRRVLC